MNSYITRLESMISRFEALMGSSDEKTLNLKADPGIWSPAQIVKHLIEVNSSYYTCFDQLIAGTYRSSPMAGLRFYAVFCGKMVLKSVNRNRKIKIKTFPVWEPGESGLQDILTQFRQSQKEMIAYIQKMENFINGKQIISSPAHRHVVYPLDLVMEIIIMHQERHFEQAKEYLSVIRKEIKS